MSSDISIAEKMEAMEEPPGAIECLTYTRGKLRWHLGQISNEDEKLHFELEQNIREIQALITVNDEIYEEIFSCCVVDTNNST